MAADLELAATGLCDRLAAPEHTAEGWYLVADYLAGAEFGNNRAQGTRLRWANRLRWDGHDWTMGEWVPANGHSSW
ncbi:MULTISPECIES: hypothetical protein [unclassified Nocardia]|uniref:hypothetical protein n=1 Tax=unclassified Nocardia TaxID=2637762 RepID=UPI0024A9B9F3|nr:MULTISPECIES: hypothetical protein [unclassified Nocardia]